MQDGQGKWDRLAQALPWLLFAAGCALALSGFVGNRMWQALPWGPAGVLAGLGLAVGLLAWVAGRATGLAPATAAAALWLLALACSAGLASLAAVCLLGLVALALGGAFIPADWPARAALSMLLGLAWLAGVTGWLLPFPVFDPAACLAMSAIVLVLSRRALPGLLGTLPTVWRNAVAGAPVAMWFAVMVAGLASTCAWFPTVHYDDLAYHLGLPSQLASLGYYKMDAASNLWAVSAWAGDVLQGLAWLLAGHESRGVLDVLWLVLGLALIWRLCAELELPPWLRCLGVALYAGLPLTAGALTGMQTEGPTAALAAGIALLVLRSAGPDRRQLFVFALLFGLLLALKISNLMLAGPLGLWLLCRWRGRLPWRAMPTALVLLLLVAGSSYAYGWLVAGNPVLPVFNAVFHSPYYTPTNFHDDHWSSGFRWNILWDLVFHTSRYIEGGDGAAGFVLVALGGSLLAAMADRRARPLALVALGAFLLPLTQIQYLRYAHPALALMIPAMLRGLPERTSAARGKGWIAAVLVVLAIANLAFVTVGDWQLRHGELGQFLAGSRQEFMQRFAPIRPLIDIVNRRYGSTARVLVTTGAAPFAADLGGKGWVVSWYDQALANRAAEADRDASGAAWQQLMDMTGASLMVSQTGQVSAGLARAMQHEHARLVAQSADLQLWEIGRPIVGKPLPSQPDTVNLGFDAASMPAQPVFVDGWVQLSCAPLGKPVAVSWSIEQAGAEPWSYSAWADCLPGGVAEARLAAAVPGAMTQTTFSAHSATATPMQLGLLASGLTVRRDFGAQRDLARRLRETIPARLARWLNPWPAVMHDGKPVADAPANSVAVALPVAAAPTRAALAHATLELDCRAGPQPIVVGWRWQERGQPASSRFAWAYCGGDGHARAELDVKLHHHLDALRVSAAPAHGEPMDLRLHSAQVGYLGNTGWAGIIRRKRIKWARWLTPAAAVTRLTP